MNPLSKEETRRAQSLETVERIIKLLQEGNSTQRCWSAGSEIWSKYKQNGKEVKGETDGSKHRDRKLKATCLKIENVQQKKMHRSRSLCLWANCRKPAEGNGINVYAFSFYPKRLTNEDITLQLTAKLTITLSEAFSIQKSQSKASVTPKEKKSRSQRAEEKQPWTVDGWMEVRFRDESPRRRCWNFSLVRWNIERWLAEENELISTISDDTGVVSGKGPGEMAAITSTGDAQVDFSHSAHAELIFRTIFLFPGLVHVVSAQMCLKWERDSRKDESKDW